MTNEIKAPKTIDEHVSEVSRKARQKASLIQKNAEEDDESGGGAGKRKQHSYKLENLLKVIEKGRLKAQAVGKFLLSEGLDANEIKKSELGKQKEKVTDSTENQLSKENVNQTSQKRSEEVRNRATVEKQAAAESTSSWQKSRAVTAQRFGLANNHVADTVVKTTNRISTGNYLQQNRNQFGIHAQANQLAQNRDTSIKKGITTQKYNNQASSNNKLSQPKGTTFAQSSPAQAAPSKSVSVPVQSNFQPGKAGR